MTRPSAGGLFPGTADGEPLPLLLLFLLLLLLILVALLVLITLPLLVLAAVLGLFHLVQNLGNRPVHAVELPLQHALRSGQGAGLAAAAEGEPVPRGEAPAEGPIVGAVHYAVLALVSLVQPEHALRACRRGLVADGVGAGVLHRHAEHGGFRGRACTANDSIPLVGGGSPIVSIPLLLLVAVLGALAAALAVAAGALALPGVALLVVLPHLPLLLFLLLIEGIVRVAEVVELQ